MNLIDITDQAPVVQKVDNGIHWIVQLVTIIHIRWIVIYLVDSAIQLLNNWGQEVKYHPSHLLFFQYLWENDFTILKTNKCEQKVGIQFAIYSAYFSLLFRFLSPLTHHYIPLFVHTLGP